MHRNVSAVVTSFNVLGGVVHLFTNVRVCLPTREVSEGSLQDSRDTLKVSRVTDPVFKHGFLVEFAVRCVHRKNERRRHKAVMGELE